VELALRIPADLKVCNGGKYILKEAARKLVLGYPTAGVANSSGRLC
jgi:hypothetical protein